MSSQEPLRPAAVISLSSDLLLCFFFPPAPSAATANIHLHLPSSVQLFRRAKEAPVQPRTPSLPTAHFFSSRPAVPQACSEKLFYRSRRQGHTRLYRLPSPAKQTESKATRLYRILNVCLFRILMDRKTWMYGIKRASNEYLHNLKEFLKVAENHRVNKGECDIWCPCKKCQNCQKLSDLNAIEEHLLIEGFMNGYTCWSQHGELLIDHSTVDVGSNYDDVDDSQDDVRDNLDEMLDDIEGDVPDNDYEKFQQLIEDSEKPLYDGCTKFTKLSAVLKLFNLKANNGWSDKSFTEILEAINEMLPEGNELPVSLYQAKKIMCAMDLEIERIHACPNDCMLYRNEHANLHECITCGTSRYLRKKQTEYNSDVKKNGPPAKLLWYLPIVPRLKRLFANANDAKLLRWHAEERKRDGKMRHVADSPQWRNIDHEFEEFGDEIRNIRFGLSADGINPFRNMSSRHSTWPVLLCIYNLPPWLYMKKLWNSGVEVYDAYKKENFELRAMIYCTISDFPAYANLSGYSTKGKKACPVCEENTWSMWLKNCNKIVYMGHRRSLPKNHLYRTRGNLFDGKTEEEDMTPPMDGETTFSRRSIFWELPYWKTLGVRHCLDVMHIEKNVCDSLISLLLNIPNKSKDGFGVREDMVAMGIRPELAPIRQEGRRAYLPPACYTMSKEEKTKFCKCLHGIKVPSGYSANIKKLVSTNDLKLIGMKSHDFHVLITHMIPIAIRGILPDRVRHAITKLCLFFNMIHSKVINPEVLDSWQRDVIITLCQLEMYFPPSFFDIMVHLVSHIVREIKACGPMFQRYMYHFERHLGSLKGLQGVGTIGLKVVIPDREEFHMAHFTVLQHMTSVAPYANEHMEMLRLTNGRMSQKWLANEYIKTFPQWLKDKVKASLRTGNVDRLVQVLGYGPQDVVTTYQGYDINGYTFYMQKQDGKSTLQNSGVTLIAMSTEYSSANHEGRSIIAKDSYYGVIQEIWELKYDSLVVVPVFKCKWVENRRGVKVDEDGFTLVNLSTHGYVSEPFILAKQANQVFFVEDPMDTRWHIVLHGKRRILGVENVVDEEEYDQFDDLPPFSIGIPSVNVDINVAAYLRSDHNEGSYVEIRLMYPASSRNSRSHNSETHEYRPSPTSRLPFFTAPIPPAPASASVNRHSVNRHSPPAPAQASISVDFALLQNDSRFPAQVFSPVFFNCLDSAQSSLILALSILLHIMGRLPRKKRSVTLIRNHSEEYLANLHVDFDEYGRPIGKNQFKFASYRGVTTRKRISILIDSWDVVDECDKDQLWLNIKNYWNIPDDKRTEDIKTQTLKDCNTQWRAYKSRLLYLWDNHIDPLGEYPYLEKKMWKNFLVLKSTEDFEEIRRKGSETAKKNKNHARLGSRGYRGMESKWNEEVNSGVTIKGHKIQSKRARFYVFARRKRNQLGQLILTPETEPLADEIIQKDIEFSQREFSGSRSDVLTEVIGPEHPGRTRGVGHNIGLKKSKIFNRKKKTPEQQMKERLEESMLNDSFYDKLKDKLIADVVDKIVPVVVTAVMQHMEVTNVSTSVGSKTSKTVLDELHNITDATDCELMLPYGTARPALAKGTVFPFADGLIHSVPLEADHLKVSIDLIYGNHQSFILPVSPVEEVHSLGDALHSFIQWPRDSIKLIKKDKGPLTKPLPVSTEDAPILRDQLLVDVSVGSPQHVPQVQKRKQKQTVRKKVMPKKPQGPRDRQIQSLFNNIQGHFTIVSEPGIFNDASLETTISKEAIIEMLNNEQLDISCILWYQMMLHSLMPISRMENKCAFVNPQEITSKRCEYDDKLETSFVITHLVDVMTFHKEKQFFLAPYWEMAVTRFKKNTIARSRMCPTTWTFPECNKQSSDWECGYYVMNWMHEFVFFRQHNFPNNMWKDTRPFSDVQLDERVNTWMKTFGEKYLK
ncbi:hypothetical protein LXL04_009827 [Taraxacum kok-saghyz]